MNDTEIDKGTYNLFEYAFWAIIIGGIIATLIWNIPLVTILLFDIIAILFWAIQYLYVINVKLNKLLLDTRANDSIYPEWIMTHRMPRPAGPFKE